MAKNIIAVGPTESTNEYNALLEFVRGLREDYVRTESGNKTAARRLRNSHLLLQKFTKAERIRISNLTKNAKTNSTNA